MAQVCLRHAGHVAKGYSTKVSEKNNQAKVILKAKSDLKATSPKVERAENSVELMNKLKSNFRKHPMPLEERGMAWCAIIWFF